MNPDALLNAEELDAERSNGAVRGPLHGVPVMVKMNIGTTDQMNTTAGSFALKGAQLSRESTVVKKLREAGAIILGKTALTQWANFRTSNMPTGWSATAGLAYGAYSENQNPGGSSSGSGVASSLGLAFACFGTDTSGSIIFPAEFNNIVGIKPTVGLTARDGVVPVTLRQDTVGPMARTVKDAASILSVIAGESKYDNYTSAIPFKTIPDYAKSCDFSALQGKRLGIPRHLFTGYAPLGNSLPIVMEAFNASLSIMRSAGATIVDNIYLPGAQYQTDAPLYVYAAGLLTDLPAYFRQLRYNPHSLHTLADLVEFTKSVAPDLEHFPEYDTSHWDRALLLNETYDSPHFLGNYTESLKIAGLLGITGAIANHSLDAIVMPTFDAAYFSSILGTPIITVPLGKFEAGTEVVPSGVDQNIIAPNKPFGISFLGDYWSEELLIGLAYAFEQKTKVRDSIKPLVKPSYEIRDAVRDRSANS